MPTYSSWRSAVDELRKATEVATARQQKLASFAGIVLPEDLPKLVAAARLKAALADELSLSDVSPASNNQLDYPSSLSAKRARDPLVCSSQEEAGAWIEFYLRMRRKKALERLRIEAGDIIEIIDSGGERIEEVVSISGNGRIQIRGGQGARAWPDSVTLKCRKDDRSEKAVALRRAAANQGSRRSKKNTWSLAREQELDDYEVERTITFEDIERLQEVVDPATDETSIQAFLEASPQILASLLTGVSRFSLPRPQLGGKHVPDFLLADIDSLGIRWLLVELETPASSVTLKSENNLDKYARKGLSQIGEWRNWIQNNLELTRRSRRDGGHGLIDIRPRSEGLVLVGRRQRLHTNSDMVRHGIREDQRVRIHTYDWLINSLRGTLRLNGPTGVNPHLIQPLRDDDDGLW